MKLQTTYEKLSLSIKAKKTIPYTMSVVKFTIFDKKKVAAQKSKKKMQHQLQVLDEHMFQGRQ